MNDKEYNLYIDAMHDKDNEIAELESDNARLRQQLKSLVEAWRNFKADKLDEYQTYRIENWEDFATLLNTLQAESEEK